MWRRIKIICCVAGIAVPTIAEAQKIYWTDRIGEKVQRANVDGSEIEELLTTPETLPGSIALDLAHWKMYWYENRVFGPAMIRRANLNGSNPESVPTSVLDSVSDIALDLQRRKIYWISDFDWFSIERANLDGSEKEIILPPTPEPLFGMALDIADRKLYWTRGIHIQRANLDGSDVEDLITTGLAGVYRIALDVGEGKMYWTDREAGKIQRANLDGSNVEDLVTSGLQEPFGLALDISGGKMYWTDAAAGKIQRANLDGSEVEDVITGLEQPWGIAFQPPIRPPIPAVSEWSLFVMALIFLAAGTIVIRCLGRPAAASPPGQCARRNTFQRLRWYTSAGAALLFMPVANVMAELEPATVPSEAVAVSVSSGSLSAQGQGTEPVVIFSELVSVPGAPWMRLSFSEVILSGSAATGDASFLRLTSLADGAVQILEPSALEIWQNTSAYFNGDEVLVELLAYPGTGDNRLAIETVVVGLDESDFESSGCVDDRLPSTDPRTARLVFSTSGACPDLRACTAFLFNGRSNCLLSAGHCCNPINFDCLEVPPVVQFNVPLSDPDGVPNHPAPQHQYCVDPASIQCGWDSEFATRCDDSPGTVDWCILGVFDNTDTGLSPLEAQGASYWLAETVPEADGEPLRVTGYGTAMGELRLTQQTARGDYHCLLGGSACDTQLSATVFAAPGNSGSAFERGCHVVFGILHSTILCEPGKIPIVSVGTRVDYPDLQAALADPQGTCTLTGNVEPPDPAGPPVGACWLPDETCQDEAGACCAYIVDSHYCGDGTSCEDAPGYSGAVGGCCPDPQVGGECYDTVRHCCEVDGGTFHADSICNPPDGPSIVCFSANMVGFEP